jgi:hypothetical protein
MVRNVLISFLFIAFSQSAFGQAVSRARESLNYFERHTFPLCRESIKATISDFCKQELNEDNSSGKSLIHKLKKESSHFKNHKVPNAHESLSTEYTRFLQALIDYTSKCSNLKSEIQADSILVVRARILEYHKSVLNAATRLEEEVAIYRIENRLTRTDDGNRIAIFFREAQKRLEYLHGIQSYLIPVIKMETTCLESLMKDSIRISEKRRSEFSKLVEINNIKLKNHPACCGDYLVKNAALNSLRLFAKEARNEIVYIENFIVSEQDFKIHCQKVKKNGMETEEDKQVCREAVRKYNTDLKGANELVINLEKTRKDHLSAFYSAQNTFVETWLKDFQE